MIIGIDPGKTGAIALLRETGELVSVWDMPMVDVGKGRMRVDPFEMCHIFSHAAKDGKTRVFLERVGPSTSAAGSFVFGHGVGVIEGVLASFGITPVMVSPQRWKTHFGLSKDKNEARAFAAKTFGHAEWFKRVRDDGRAESCCVALWGLQNGGVA